MQKRGTKIRRRQKKKAPPSTLILECAADRLAAQSISIAQELDAVMRQWVPAVPTRLVRATTLGSLLSHLAQCKEERKAFGIVVVVGHSNMSGLWLTADVFVPWEAFSRWIQPFEPERMILVACEAGRWLPSKALFQGIASLKEIYGSPVAITPQQASAVKLLLPYLLMGGRLRKNFLQLAQAANFLLTGRVIFRKTRKEFQRAGIAEGMLWTGLEELMKAALRR
jgi:hypothetical protein